MSFLKKLFGGGRSQGFKPESYQGCTIHPEPVQDGNGYRLTARIEKEIGGEVKTHMLIRADVLLTAEDAAEASIAKAKQVIDQVGDRLFG